jgi:hypothetical protein
LPKDCRALFSISDPSPNSTFLVLRIEKVLQGELDANTEPYIKSDSIKDKEKEKFIAASSIVCARLPYWQPFAWGMVPIFNDDLTLSLEENFGFRPIYKARENEGDEEFLNYMQDVSKVRTFKFEKKERKKERIMKCYKSYHHCVFWSY